MGFIEGENVSELGTTLAAIICHTSEVEVSADNLNKILKAAGVTVDAYYPKCFASLLVGKDVGEFLKGGVGGGGGGGGGAAADAGAGAPAAAAAPEPEPEEEEEEEEDMGFSLFD